MTTSARAVVSEGGRLSVTDVEVRDPRPGEVLVEMRASGVCHTDHDLRQLPLRFVLGHEGAGVVAALGAGVDHVRLGDRVVLNWAMPCGACFQCVRGAGHLCERHSPVVGRAATASRGGTTLGDSRPVLCAFDLGTLATHTVVRAEAVQPLTGAIPFTSAAILGCGVMTGFGSVVNAARVPAGASVVVIGCGGVGLSIVQGARIAGADPIVAVDRHAERLELARRLGAGTVLTPAADDDDLEGVARQVREMTGGRGADYAFESTGVPALAASPLRMIRHGGMALQVSGTEQTIAVDMRLFEFDKTYVNPLYGHCRPDRDVPRLLALYEQGELLLDEMVTDVYPLDEVQQAFDDMLAGRGAKRVVVFDGES
jgi:S-(hydroxymethyl)glutathione dehydrogenase/alcohol dehydrogenase